MSLLVRRLGGASEYSYVGSGGITFAGAGGVARTRAYTPSGGLVFGGAAPYARVRAWPSTGGVTFGGTAPTARVRAWLGSGGLVFAGAAITSPPLSDSLGGYVPSPDRRRERIKRRLQEEDEIAVLIAALMGPYRRG